MIVPNKYDDISKNMLTLGINVLNLLDYPKNVYILYKELLKFRNDRYEIEFSNFILTLDFLFALDLIKFNKEKVSKV
jgi:hypothetical protein